MWDFLFKGEETYVSEGIKNSTNAIINITGGTIYGNSTGYAIYNAGDGGVINIGNKEPLRWLPVEIVKPFSPA